MYSSRNRKPSPNLGCRIRFNPRFEGNGIVYRFETGSLKLPNDKRSVDMLTGHQHKQNILSKHVE